MPQKLTAVCLGVLVVSLSTCCPATTGREVVSGPGDREGGAVERGGASEAPPQGRLPADVRPTRYALDLRLVPAGDRFSGSVRIAVRLESPRSVLWLHGRGLHVTQASVVRPDGADVPARWEQIDDDGLAALRFDEPIGPGPAEIRLAWDAPFATHYAGIMHVQVGSEWYAFTQFEDVWARRAFPCFDEPGWKTPWDVSLTVHAGDVAIGNTMPLGRESSGEGLERVRFATTDPLPTYLLAWAVGPLDVVDAAPLPPTAVRDRPVPIRGIAAHGRGPQLAQALAEVGPTLQALETYFAIAYPYAKMDVIAVPHGFSGAMENAAAVTFAEPLLLLDPATVTEEQRRAMSWVMAHEFAHQWFGDLVTMEWWDDIWLNEGFASWMEAHVEEQLHPEYRSKLSELQGVQDAMGADGLVSARQIRQPIRTRDDITAAFDEITYQKGAGTLAMFERWLGAETFQRGIRRYLEAHRFGSATSADLLAALSEAAGRDVATPMSTFLEQNGVPLVEARTECTEGAASLVLRQSRYLPVGSSGETNRRWQVPVCARYAAGGQIRETCTLLTEAEGRVALEGGACPAWVMPNADAAGYFRWSLPPAEAARLTAPAVWTKLSPRERLSVAETLDTDYAAARMPAAAVLARIAPIARDAERRVATAPLSLLTHLREHGVSEAVRPKVEAFARKLYAPVLQRIGMTPRAGAREDGDTTLLRKRLVEFLALQAHDPAVRREMERRGRAYAPLEGPLHPEAVSADLAEIALIVAVQQGDEAYFASLRARLRDVEDAVTRERIVSALAHVTAPALSRQALDLVLDPMLHPDELTHPLWTQLDQPETREAAWTWLSEHFDALLPKLDGFQLAYAPWLANGLCDGERARQVRALFEPRVDRMPGAPPQLAQVLEVISLCEARVNAQRASSEAFFAGR